MHHCEWRWCGRKYGQILHGRQLSSHLRTEDIRGLKTVKKKTIDSLEGDEYTLWRRVYYLTQKKQSRKYLLIIVNLKQPKFTLLRDDDSSYHNRSSQQVLLTITYSCTVTKLKSLKIDHG